MMMPTILTHPHQRSGLRWSFVVLATVLPLATPKVIKMCMHMTPIGTVRTDPIIRDDCVSGHLHTFYGPPLLHPGTTNAELEASTVNTMEFEENHSLYWHPSIYKQNDATGEFTLAPISFSTAYYRWDNTMQDLEPYPSGFRMITGIAPNNDFRTGIFSECCTVNAATGEEENCFEPEDGLFPTESCDFWGAAIRFPICWDGQLDDSNDHTSHLRYTSDGTLTGDCPDSHSRRLPQLQLFLRIDNYEGGTYTFADETDILHADFMNGWKDGTFQMLLNDCDGEDGVGITDQPGSFDDDNPPCACTDLLTTKTTVPCGTVDGTLITPENVLVFDEFPNGECGATLFDKTPLAVSDGCDIPSNFPEVPGSRSRDGDDGGDDGDDDDDDDGLQCFSSFNTVSVRGKGPVRMDALEIGDYVQTFSGFSRVLSFGHLDRQVDAQFLQIKGANGQTVLEISKDHVVHIANRGWKRAADLKVGDSLDSLTTIEEILTVRRKGIFAPTTESGELIVSGVRASCFSALMDSSIINPWLQHTATHIFHAPLRLVCYWDFTVCMEETYDSHGFSNYVSWAANLVQKTASSIHIQLAGILIASPVFILATVFEEFVLHPATSAAALLILGTAATKRV